MTRPTLRAALGTVVAAGAVPQGFTVSIWSCGAVLARAHGLPDVAEILAFAAGALAGFMLMALVADSAPASARLRDHSPDRVTAGMPNWLAVSAALGAVVLIARLPAAAAWPLGSLAVTAIYFVGASCQLALMSRRRRRPVRADAAAHGAARGE